MSKNSVNPSRNNQKYITERIKIDKFIPGGQAIATLENGKKIMLWNALPGEIVSEVEVTKSKSHFLEGIATKIEDPSSLRITPRDDCYLATSPWQNLKYEAELEQKALLLHEIFRQHGIKLEDNFQVFTGDEFFYRNKMEYALYYSHEDNQIHLAFHARGSHRKIPIEQSSLERPEIFQAAQKIIAELNQTHADARQFQSLLLRCNQDGQVSGGLFENGKPHPIFPTLSDSLPVDSDFAHTFTYSPNGFFQINLPMYSAVLHRITETIMASSVSNVLDLYAGVGTIGLTVAPERDLTLVECDKSAHREMLANVKSFPNHKIHPVLAKSEEALEYIAPDQIVIVDPPRAGCRPEVITKFLSELPQQIIYLSCNPVTQARDVKMLLEKYQIADFQPYNFFPRTPHIENLIILEAKHGVK